MSVVVSLLKGDSLTLLNDITVHSLRPEAGKISKADACVCDPPYGFDFGGSKDWDTFKDGRSHAEAVQDAEAFAKFTEGWVRGVMNRLWPGGHVVAFSADRTIDLVARGMRLANLDIVRMIAWMYATGQVKHKDNLRPGFEPILVGRYLGQMGNLDDLKKLFKEKGRGQLHAQEWKKEDGKHPTNVILSEDAVSLDEELIAMVEANKASFFVPKPSTKDRDWGCADLPVQKKDNELSHYGVKDEAEREKLGLKSVMAQNIHPTVKPIELMRRLIRLVSRPGHTIIDPFMGSGTCGIAAVLEGRNYIGIEREDEYFTIAQTRINSALQEVEGQKAA